MKTLIIGPSWVGDMVMSQSLYITLKKQQPDMELHVMAPRWCLPLLARMPQVDQAIEMPLGHGDFKLTARWRLGRELKQNQYTQAIVLPNSLKSALIPLFAQIPKRTGWKGESRYGLLNDLRNNKKAFPLMVQRYIALAFARQKMRSEKDILEIPYPALQVNKAQQQAAMSRLSVNLNKPVLGLCPGAEFGPSKRWPERALCSDSKAMDCQRRRGMDIWLAQRSAGSQHYSAITARRVANALSFIGRQYQPDGSY